jgi:hypothetical protein
MPLAANSPSHDPLNFVPVSEPSLLVCNSALNPMPEAPLDESHPTQSTDQTMSPILLPPMTTRSHTGSLRPKQFPGFKLFHTKYPLLSFHSTLPDIEPTCYSKVATNPQWRTAMSA